MAFEIHKSIGNRYAIILTTKCNNNCVYCHSATNYEPFFKFEFVKDKVLKEIPKNAVEIQLTGGEPTIVPYLFDFLEFLKENYPKTKIKIQSNVRMFSIEHFTRKISKYIDQIQTTFHSYDERTFDAITRVRDSYKQKIKALSLIKKYNIDIYFNILILKLNYKQLKETVVFLRNLYKEKDILLDYPLYLNNALKNRRMIYVSLNEAKPYIQEALIDEKVLVYNIPPCVFDESFRRHVTRQGFIHDDRYVYPLKECNSCSLKDVCGGYYRQNLELFHNYDDFKPILKN